MNAIRKFNFETVFAPDGAIVRDGSGFRTQFDAEEVAAERASAFAEGERSELARAEKAAADALVTLAQQMKQLLAALGAESRQLKQEGMAVALAAARLVADSALDAFGAARVEAAVGDAMETLRDNPRLSVRVHPSLIEALRPRLVEAAAAHGYGGALLVRADPQVRGGDVRLEWADGAIVHDRQEAFARVEAAIAHHLREQASPEEARP